MSCVAGHLSAPHPNCPHAAGIAWGCYMSVSCINQAPAAACAAAVAATAALQSSQPQE